MNDESHPERSGLAFSAGSNSTTTFVDTATAAPYPHIAQLWGIRLDDRYGSSVIHGDCPKCGEPWAWAWEQRRGRRDDWWTCAKCGTEGTLYNLHHELIDRCREARP